MVLYVILFFVAICIGMAISVYAFGTGGKRKKIFQDIYFSVEETDGIGVLYTKTGEYSAILRMENPVQKYSANIDSYYEFTNLFAAIAQTLGLRHPIYTETASYGHVGRTPQIVEKTFIDGNGQPFTLEVELFSWEKLDKVDEIKALFGL